MTDNGVIDQYPFVPVQLNYLSIYLSIYLVNLSIYLAIYLVNLSIYLSS